jgi:hypothetical protein
VVSSSTGDSRLQGALPKADIRIKSIPPYPRDRDLCRSSAERLHLASPREAVLAAWMILADGKKGAVALGARDQEGWLSNDQADRATSLIF